jgi:hypothetical protein
LIALAMVVGLLDGLPIPAGAERQVMEKRLSPGMVAMVDRIDRIRQKLLTPFRPVGETFKLRQRWKLFSGAADRRYRMRIEVRRDDSAEWELIYRVLDDEHAFLAAPIEYRRVRGAWNPHTTSGTRGGYPAFVGWVAGRVFARMPDVAEVRVVQERIVIAPHGGYRGTGELVYGRQVRRADLAKEPR